MQTKFIWYLRWLLNDFHTLIWTIRGLTRFRWVAFADSNDFHLTIWMSFTWQLGQLSFADSGDFVWQFRQLPPVIQTNLACDSDIASFEIQAKFVWDADEFCLRFMQISPKVRRNLVSDLSLPQSYRILTKHFTKLHKLVSSSYFKIYKNFPEKTQWEESFDCNSV